MILVWTRGLVWVGEGGRGGGGAYGLGVGLEEEGRVVKPVFAFGVVGHGGRRGVRLALALGGWWRSVGWTALGLLRGYLALLRLQVVGVVGRRVVVRDQLARSSVVVVTLMVMVDCGDGVLALGSWLR